MTRCFPEKWRSEFFCLWILVSQIIFFRNLYLKILGRKIALKLAKISENLQIGTPKFSDKKLKRFFGDSYTQKQKPHYAIFRGGGEMVIVNDSPSPPYRTAYRTLLGDCMRRRWWSLAIAPQMSKRNGLTTTRSLTAPDRQDLHQRLPDILGQQLHYQSVCNNNDNNYNLHFWGASTNLPFCAHMNVYFIFTSISRPPYITHRVCVCGGGGCLAGRRWDSNPQPRTNYCAGHPARAP